MSAAKKLVEEAVLEELRSIRAELQALRREQSSNVRELLSAAGAARLLGIDRGRIARLVRAGVLPGRQTRGRYEVRRADVVALAERGIPPEPGRAGRPRKPLPANVSDEILKLDVG